MNVLARFAGFAACAFAVATALPAAAAPYTQIFTGNVVAGSADPAGLFGGGNIGGDAITLSFVYSLTDGAIRGKSFGLDTIYGGSSNSAPSAILSVIAIINGVTQSISSLNLYNEVSICAASECGTAYTESTAQDGGGNKIDVSVLTGPLLANLAKTQSSAGSDGGSEFTYDGDDFALNLTNVSFVTSVPEPAAVAALGAGLLALGMIRRRRV